MVSKIKIVLGDVYNSTIKPWNSLISVTDFMLNSLQLIKKDPNRVQNFLNDIKRRKKKIWIDSGGYQIMKRKIKVKISDLIKLYNDIDADFYISLDMPPEPKDSNKIRLKKIKKSFENYKIIVRKVGHKDETIIPVIHFTPNLEQLKYQIDLYEDFSVKRIAIGGLVPFFLTAKKMRNSREIGLLFLMIARKYIAHEIHVMGLGSPTTIPLIKRISIDSTDSSSWRIKAAFGKIILPCHGERHITERKVNFGKKKITDKELNYIKSIVTSWDGVLISKYGEFNRLIESIKYNFEDRALFNAWVISILNKYDCKNKALKNLHNLVERYNNLSLEDLEKVWGELIERSWKKK
ncbi:MAG: hypothetical protein ACP6IP_00170 [Candidatus Njordarchaeia archaeon]